MIFVIYLVYVLYMCNFLTSVSVSTHFIGLELVSTVCRCCNRSQMNWTVSSKRWRSVEALWPMAVSVKTILSTLFSVCGHLPSYVQQPPGSLALIGLHHIKEKLFVKWILHEDPLHWTLIFGCVGLKHIWRCERYPVFLTHCVIGMDGYWFSAGYRIRISEA